MPNHPTYPGVYVQERPTGENRIQGVATSITAFLGRAARGPVEEPTPIHDFSEYERRFGGLGLPYPVSYAVRDFFMNGGAHAIIVRLHHTASGDGRAQLDVPGLPLVAASPGSWANAIRVRVDHYIPSDLPWLSGIDLVSADLFNLTVRDTATGVTEAFFDLTVADTPRRVDRVLARESTLIRLNGSVPDDVPDAHGSPGTGQDVWGDPALSSPVSMAGHDGEPLPEAAYKGSQSEKTGLFALQKADLFNLLCIPPDTRGGTTTKEVYEAALGYCQARRAILIVDPPATWDSAATAGRGLQADLGLTGPAARNAALYFPRLVQSDPLRDGRPDTFVPCGTIAGVIARTDAQRGVWKAPAGIHAALRGTRGLAVPLTDAENGTLNPMGINSLRSFPGKGTVIWGSRTLRGADALSDEFKYLPVRRLALFLEESLERGTRWAVFEPNQEPLWAELRLSIGTFMHNLFRQGAFQGSTPTDAYFVKVDRETTSQNDIDLGFVNLVVGFAPLRPAEFVVITIPQKAGQSDT